VSLARQLQLLAPAVNSQMLQEVAQTFVRLIGQQIGQQFVARIASRGDLALQAFAAEVQARVPSLNRAESQVSYSFALAPVRVSDV
jgi:hypothetical protein